MDWLVWIKRAAFVCVAAYIVITVIAYFAQRKLLYFPPSNYLTPSDVGVPEMAEIEMRYGDESWATAWWVPPSAPEGKIVMVFHGNGSAVFSNYHIYRDLIDAGHGVWGVGYPGYPGRAPVKSAISQDAIVQAAITQYDDMQVMNQSDRDIVFYGTSLGTGVAAQLAAEREPSLLIMDAPFNSVLDMAKRQMPILPVALLTKDKFQSDRALADVRAPLIWIHGTRDQVVPISQGEKLFDNYAAPKTAYVIEGGQHMNLWALGGRDITLAALVR